MATYTWTIEVLFTKDITKDGTTYPDAIIRVGAMLTGQSDTIPSISSGSYFDLDIDVDNIGSNFISYSSVTEAEVITWVQSRVDPDMLADIKAGIERDIEFKEKVYGANPKEDAEGNPTFPWGTPN
jgi:hypothetical protein